MDAKEALKQIFETFEPNVLIDFFRAIGVRTLTPFISSYKIEVDTSLFCTPDLLGVIKLENEDELAVFTIKVVKSLTERSGKKAQYELAKKILKTENRYPAGIFIFHDDKNDFRFSLVYSVPLATGKRDWSNFRRYTYFVSKEQTNKTFIHQITQADFSSVETLTEVFSVEKVTKAFYDELQNWYFWAMDKISFPEDYTYSTDPTKDKEIHNATNLIRLITRIIFIWFLKEKNLIPPDLFSKEKLKKNVQDFMKDKRASNFYNAILQNLFFATLNQKMNERKFAEENGYPANKKEYGVKNLYRYANKFLINKDEVLKLFKDIPFLNGGLFDCLDKEYEKGKVLYIDGFSRNTAKQSIIPDYLFFQQEEKSINLSQYGLGANRPVRGLFEILNSYNFTIDENTLIDQEIALDPELLGKVFENLLASYNPETATTARKATGSYYTPREIVDHMVEVSLFEYLKGKLPETEEEKIKLLLSYSEEIPEFSEEEKQKIISAIDEIKILDPACGSGAFPMGILHKLVFALQKLDPENKYWHNLQYQKALNESEEVFKQGDKNQREEMLKEINETFDDGINYPDYARKLFLIENCIYGVDIQPIAIQISKLRFFISLVLDQKVDKEKENFGIRALPNLETRFVAANTLIGLDKPDHLFYTDTIKRLEDEIKALRHKYFTAKSRREKLEYQRNDRELREQLSQALKSIGFSSDSSENIAKFDIYDQNASADWFDSEWMFGVTDEFDIVIGNPPYVQLQKAVDANRKYADLYKDQNFKTFDRTGDIYCLFYEKGINLLCDGGHLAFITSNKWMRAGYGEKLRQFFNSYNPKILIDLGPGVFENATVDTNILIIQKAKNQHQLHAVTITEKKKDNIDFSTLLEQNGVILQNLTGDAWFIGSDAEQRLKEKIERIGKPLKEWDVNIYYGIKTGLNEAFIIDDAMRNEILENCKDEDERRRTEAIIKPILRGRDIKRYYYEWAGLWVIFIPSGWTNENRNKENAEYFITKQFPALMNHLKRFETKAKSVMIRAIIGGNYVLVPTTQSLRRRRWCGEIFHIIVNFLMLNQEYLLMHHLTLLYLIK